MRYLGNVQPLPNGDQLVVFSQLGRMDEVSPEGALVRSVKTRLGWTFGYAHQTAERRPVAGQEPEAHGHL